MASQPGSIPSWDSSQVLAVAYHRSVPTLQGEEELTEMHLSMKARMTDLEAAAVDWVALVPGADVLRSPLSTNSQLESRALSSWKRYGRNVVVRAVTAVSVIRCSDLRR